MTIAQVLLLAHDHLSGHCGTNRSRYCGVKGRRASIFILLHFSLLHINAFTTVYTRAQNFGMYGGPAKQKFKVLLNHIRTYIMIYVKIAPNVRINLHLGSTSCKLCRFAFRKSFHLAACLERQKCFKHLALLDMKETDKEHDFQHPAANLGIYISE